MICDLLHVICAVLHIICTVLHVICTVLHVICTVLHVICITGVFGAGKSFLLSVMIQFLVKVFDLNGSYSPGLPYPWKILISSTTNVAVDRVLMG